MNACVPKLLSRHRRVLCHTAAIRPARLRRSRIIQSPFRGKFTDFFRATPESHGRQVASYTVDLYKKVTSVELFREKENEAGWQE